MLEKLTVALNIREGEERLVALLLIHSFFIGLAKIFTSTAAITIFIDKFGPGAFPYAYIGVAVVVSLIGFGYTKLEQYLSFVPLLTTNLLFLLAGVVIFYGLLIMFPAATAPALGLIIWFEVIWAMTSLEFWGLASKLFDLRQGKRLFGLIGSGDVVAVIISGFSMTTLVAWAGVENLLLFSVVGLLGSLILMQLISRSYSHLLSSQDSATATQATTETPSTQSMYKDIFSDHYTVLICTLTAVAFLAYYVIDNLFYYLVQDRYPDPTQLAIFIGNFLAVSNILSLVIRIFVAGPLIERFGVLGGLLMLPLFIIGNGLIVVLTGAIWGAIPFLFWLGIGTKLFDSSTRFSLYRAASLILYQPLSADRQMRILTIAESFVEPMAGGVAGLLLLFLVTYSELGAIGLSYAVIVLVIIWLMIIYRVNIDYKKVLLQALNKRKLGGELLVLADNVSTNLIEQGLESHNVGQVIYSLSVLEELHHESFAHFLRRALRHPAPEVRLDTLDRIERNQVYSTLRQVRLLVRYDADDAVKAKAIRVLAALGGTEVIEEIKIYLDDSNLKIRKEAMVGLLRSGGIEGVLIAGQHFFTIVESPKPVERRLAAQVLGDVGISSFYQPLETLLSDRNQTVLNAALQATGKLQPAKLWPRVINHVSSPALSTSASSALVAGGTLVVPEIQKAIKRPDISPQTVIRFTKILGRIKGEAATTLLVDLLDHPEKLVRHQAIYGLTLCEYQAPQEKSLQIFTFIKTEVETLVWILTISREFGADNDFVHLCNVLNTQFERGIDRLFLLTAFICDRTTILQGRDIIQRPTSDATQRAYALEAIELALPETVKRWLLPLFDSTLSVARRLKLLEGEFPYKIVNQQTR
ncbi:MAG: Npt1/Npt2 family nucleotide transporter, partial [Chloroflexota bacterium]